MVALRRVFVPEPGASDLPDDAPRAPHATALAAVVIVLAAACLPFLFNERTGVLGEGIYTNDQAAQLFWTDWLQEGFGPEPKAVRFGYPTGPQSLTATVAEVTHADLDDAFNGLLVAIPVLAALAALAALGSLAPIRRVVAASLVALPYLAASFLAQSAFKETVMALLVLALASCSSWAPPARSPAARRSAPCSSSRAARSSPTASPASPGSRSRCRSGRSPSTRSAAVGWICSRSPTPPGGTGSRSAPRS